MAKKYYWLKLKDDFFSQPKIKKLRRIAGGDTYTIIYLKMQLLSLKNEGKLFFDGIENDFTEEIALNIDEDPENVKVTILYLLQQGLLEEVEKDEFIMAETVKSICSETQGAERIRRHRENLKALQCNTDVQKCNTEIRDRDRDKREDIEIDMSDKPSKPSKPVKHKYGNYKNVLLDDLQYEKLLQEFPTDYQERIERLSEYVASTGKTYKNHLATIRSWVKKDKPNEKSISFLDL